TRFRPYQLGGQAQNPWERGAAASTDYRAYGRSANAKRLVSWSLDMGTDPLERVRSVTRVILLPPVGADDPTARPINISSRLALVRACLYATKVQDVHVVGPSPSCPLRSTSRRPVGWFDFV